MSLELLTSVAQELISPQVLSPLSLPPTVCQVGPQAGSAYRCKFTTTVPSMHSDITISRGEPHPLCPFLKTSETARFPSVLG